MHRATIPPLDGSLDVVPGFLDFHVKHNPDAPFAIFPSASGNGTTSVSYKELADASHKIAHAVRPMRQGPEGEVVGVILNCDTILYLAVLVGLTRAGMIPFPMSPRNTAQAVVNMLEKTSSHRIISQGVLSPLLDAVKQELDTKTYSLRIDELPDFNQIFPSLSGNQSAALSVEPYPKSSRPPAKEDIVLYLHSSGSTGFPKPIGQTQQIVLEWCRRPILDAVRQKGIIWAAQFLPSFHTMGIYSQLYTPLSTGCPTGLFTPQFPAPPVVPTARNTLDTAKIIGCTGSVAIPSFVETWAQSDEDIETLKTFKLLGFAGGPLSEKGGNRLAAAGVHVFNVYGSTETGSTNAIIDPDDYQGPEANVKTSADWSWIAFAEDQVHCRWVPEGDGSYELQFLTCETHHPAVENLEDVRGYATSDLFTPHPRKKGLWHITGRKDDVIVLGTGEKVVPIPQEGHLVANPMVSGAVMFGRGRAQCGLLIEPHEDHAVDPSDEAALVAFRNKIWPVVEEANAIAPAFAKIFKEMIIVTDPARPLPRAGKGTVIRKQALLLYENEVEEVYKAVENSSSSDGIAPPSSWSSSDLEDWLLKHAIAITGHEGMSPETDVFAQGFDSLHATFLRNRIIGALRGSPDAAVQGASANVSQNFVFEHPTLRDLASAISGLVDPSNAAQKEDPVAEISSLITSYSSEFPKSSSKADTSARDVVVLFTGTTGNIGSHTLAALLEDSKITRIYTLNRFTSTSAADRQAKAFEERDLPVDLLKNPKLVELYGDVALGNFGLKQTVYEELRKSVTHVIHNSWKVDFNLSLKSFEPLIASSRKLVDACYEFEHPVVLLFSSSIATSAAWDPSNGPVPEEPLADPRTSVPTGYGSSKFIVEHILANAAAPPGFRTTTVRIGQVCGSESTGVWSTHEWVPTLVKSSIALGALPESSTPIEWIPMDAVAKAFVDFLVAKEPLPPVVNLVHPRAVPWNTVIRNINKQLATPLPIIPFNEWVTRLEAVSDNASAEQLEKIPAIKLLEFFRTVFGADSSSGPATAETGTGSSFKTTKSQLASPAIRQLPPLGEGHARSWVKYWRKIGYIQDT